MAPTVREIVGFDLGHGETALAQLVLDADSSCKLIPIRGRTSQVTAFARLPSGEIVLGEDAIWAGGSEHLDVAFKSKPAVLTLEPEHPDALQWQQNREKLKTFALACYEALVGTYIKGASLAKSLLAAHPGGHQRRR